MDLNKDSRTTVRQEGNSEAERLNRGCFCITLDRYALMEALNREVGSQDFAQGLRVRFETQFATVPGPRCSFIEAEE